MSHDSNPASNKTTKAMYALRAAAEAKAVAAVRADVDPTPAASDALLEAQLDLESKTEDAVEACAECGHAHASNEPHHVDNVLPFRNATGRHEDRAE